MRFYIGAVGDWSYANATEVVDFVRFPHDRPLESSAEGADASVAGWIIEDSQGVYDVQGMLPAWVDEDDAEVPPPNDSHTGTRIWTGFVTVRRWMRAEGYRTGPARLIEVDLIDINNLLRRHAIVTDGGKRPVETDQDRIEWLLSVILNGVVYDNGLLDYSPQVYNLDEADYRDSFAVDVLGDLAAISAKDFYVIWDESAAPGQHVTLVYEKRSTTQRAASIGISNVRTDQNQDTIWEPSWDSVLERDPSEVYSGVDQVYLGGNRVYLQDTGTLATFFGTANESKDLVVSSSRIGKTATATSQALIQLAIHSEERDTIEARLFLPVERVNWVMAGQSILFRATHMDGYETAQTMKVLRKSVIHPWPDRRRFYEVALRLANGEAGAPIAGGGGDHNPPPDDFPPPVDTGPCVPSDSESQVTGIANGWATRTDSSPNFNGSSGYGNDGHYGPGYGDPGPTGYETFWGFWADNHGHWYCGYTIQFPSPVNWTSFNIYWGSGAGTQAVPTNILAGTGTAPTDETGIGTGSAFTLVGANVPPGAPSSDGYSRFEIDDPSLSAGVDWIELIWDHGVFGPGLDVHNFHSFREIGTYECIDPPASTTPPGPGQWIRDIKVADGDGTTTSFASPFPFADGSLHVRYDTVDQTPAIASYDGAAGTFVMQGAPLDGQQVFIDIQGR